MVVAAARLMTWMTLRVSIGSVSQWMPARLSRRLRSGAEAGGRITTTPQVDPAVSRVAKVAGWAHWRRFGASTSTCTGGSLVAARSTSDASVSGGSTIVRRAPALLSKTESIRRRSDRATASMTWTP